VTTTRNEEPRSATQRLEDEGEIAADYLEELLDIADLDGEIDMDIDHGRATVDIVTENDGSLAHLAGKNGEVLDALQELTRLAVQARTGERSRLMLDIGGYRAKRRAELTVVAEKAIEKVRSTGEAVALDPLNAFERKVVHDVVTAAGLTSVSYGVDPERYIEIQPAD
jgi:spoIIIJ-associated protein